MFPVILTLAAVSVFSGASVFFAEYSKKHSPLWMNTIKALVALCAFGLSVFALWLFGFAHFNPFTTVGRQAALYLVLSGMCGLAVGDIFLLSAYARIGSARSLMIFSFQPLFMGIGAYFVFGQTLSIVQSLAVLMLVACVFTLSFEKFKMEGRWEVRGILYAVIGVLFDNVGVILTRSAFDLTGMHPIEANTIRCLGAVAALLVICFFRKEKLVLPFKNENKRNRAIVVAASFFGAYVSLLCYLTALRVGHLATLSAIIGLNPLAAGVWEWIFLGEKPSPIFVFCFTLSLGALMMLLLAT